MMELQKSEKASMKAVCPTSLNTLPLVLLPALGALMKQTGPHPQVNAVVNAVPGGVSVTQVAHCLGLALTLATY